jgi:hypothetical protein
MNPPAPGPTLILDTHILLDEPHAYVQRRANRQPALCPDIPGPPPRHCSCSPPEERL